MLVASRVTTYHDVYGGSSWAPVPLSTMKIFTRFPPSLQLTLTGIISVFAFTTSRNQRILQDSNIGVTEANVKHLLAAHNNDPVEVIHLLDPVYATVLDEPRLVEVLGTEPVWMTEGDKLRLKKQGLSFMDFTGHGNRRSSVSGVTQRCVFAGWPDLGQQERVHEVIKNMHVEEMAYNLGNLTTFYNRYCCSQFVAWSSGWIHNKVLEVGLYAPTVGPVVFLTTCL